MKIFVLTAVIVFLAVSAYAGNNHTEKPSVQIDASLVTSDGSARVFKTPSGTVEWTPSLPVYKGDRLTVSFTPQNGFQPYRVMVKLDNRPYADLKNTPWKVQLDTSSLKPGKHVLKADIRFAGTPRAYSVASFPFYVHDALVQVKGTVEEIGSTGDSEAKFSPLTGPTQSFTPPAPGAIREDIQVTLRSLDSQADKALAAHKELKVECPVAFRLDAKPGVDRWAYSLVRDGRQIAGGGPVARSVYLEVAPKGSDNVGLLPGKLMLYAWGIRNDGAYSPPVEVPLFIEK